MKSGVGGDCDKEAFHHLAAALLDATEHRDTGKKITILIAQKAEKLIKYEELSYLSQTSDDICRVNVFSLTVRSSSPITGHK